MSYPPDIAGVLWSVRIIAIRAGKWQPVSRIVTGMSAPGDKPEHLRVHSGTMTESAWQRTFPIAALGGTGCKQSAPLTRLGPC